MWTGVFEGRALENIFLPSTLTRIEYSAFSSCKDLKDINLPSSLEYIGKCCFSASGLTVVQVPAAGVQAAENAFDDCPAKDSLVFCNGKVFPKGQ